MAKVLLHTCCGPCLIYSYEKLTKEGHDVTCFYYNPNIHPFKEYKERLKSVRKCCKELSIPLIVGDYEMEEYFRRVAFHEDERCSICYNLRLEKTAKIAKSENLDAFTTTLTISPYQSIESIKEIGGKVAQEIGVQFLFKDFREGFKESHEKAKEMDLYMQKYCGCLFSEWERYDKRKERKRVKSNMET
ncbi:MAG TPA: epoxyqueuosine reductase QueH [Actinobacteria bacterium]|nr:epoxyqueuosine reductase QueH [Actinomycetota bacterium]